MLMKSSMLGACAAAAIAATVAPAAAQESDAAGPAGLPDIAVTAERRLASVHDIPIAISAFSADKLEAHGAENVLDVFQSVPNVFVSHLPGLGSANAYYMRGIGSSETLASFDPPVGSYIDDVYISRLGANNFRFFDVERVEVLRGPQGTLFGRNTTGGAISIVMKEPGQQVGGFIEGSYGRYDEQMLRGSIDVPLADGTLALKVSGYSRTTDGYVKNVSTGERLNDSDASGIRFGAKLRATNTLSWNLAFAFMRDEGVNLLNFDCNPGDSADCGGRFATTGLRKDTGVTQFPTLPISGRKASFGLGNQADTQLFTSNIEWAGENMTLNIITGYYDLSQQYGLDFTDGRAAPSLAQPSPPVLGLAGAVSLNDSKHKQFTQEFKLSGQLIDGFLDYVAGVHFHNEDNTTALAQIVDRQALGETPASEPTLVADRSFTNNTNATAGYLQVDAHPSRTLTLTGGIRYTDEQKTFSFRDNRPICAGADPVCLDTANLIAENGTAIPTKQTTKLWTPRIAANYKPNEDVMLFASAARGYRSGGWNAGATSPDEVLPFGAEKVWSYETGFKSEWLDRRVRVNLTGFFIDASGSQVPSTLAHADGSLSPVTRNAADFENKGVELEVAAIPFTGLNVYANLGWQDAKYKIDRDAPPTDAFGVQSVASQQTACLAQLAAGLVAGGAGADNAASCGIGLVAPNGDIADPVRSPDWTLAVGGSYDFQLPVAGVVITPAVNASYRSKAEVDTSGVSILTGTVTGPSGAVYPANAISGDFITGSRSASNVLVNASLALRTDDDTWMVSVECDNCLNETYAQSSLANFSYLNPPMTWTLRARRKF